MHGCPAYPRGLKRLKTIPLQCSYRSAAIENKKRASQR